MTRPLLIRGARQLLTLRGSPASRRGAALGKLEIISDGAVLIQDGFVKEVGPSRRVEALADARLALEIDASGCVVMPGFVDSAAYLVTGPMRGSDWECVGQPDGAWSSTINQTSRRTLEARGVALLEEFVRHGTTFVEARSGFGFDEAGELKILRTHAALKRRTSMVASAFMGALRPPGEASVDEYVEWMCGRMLPMLKRRRLAEFAGIACGPQTLPLEHARRYLSVASGLGFTPIMHADRTQTGAFVEEAVRIGAAAVDGLENTDENVIEMLGGSDTIATLIPGPVFFTGRGDYPRARGLIDRGAAIALATGYHPHLNPSASMQMVIVLACRNMGLTVAEAITAATMNGACAMRQASWRGSLEPGKIADVVILRTPDYREIGWNYGVNLVDTTVLQGTVIYKRARINWSGHCDR